MSAAADVLERFFAAINRNDLQALGREVDPQIVRIEPEGFATGGTYRGIEAFLAHVASGRGSWAEGRCEPEKILLNGDLAVVYLHVRVRLQDATDWIDARFADGFVFRDGRIIEHRSFARREEAHAWAGLEG